MPSQAAIDRLDDRKRSEPSGLPIGDRPGDRPERPAGLPAGLSANEPPPPGAKARPPALGLVDGVEGARPAMSVESGAAFAFRLPAPNALVPAEICPPAEIAARICRWSRAKTQLPLDRLLVLGVLAGVYIGFGAALSALVVSDGVLGLGTMRWLGGIAFSLGLVLVVVGGAELSTGNCLMALAYRAGAITSRQMWFNWLVTFAANCAGAAVLAWLIVRSGAFDAALVRATVLRSAEAKLALSFEQAFLRGILANMLVCLAVWLTFSTQTVIGKLIGIVFPISAFVALGFEHSIANCFTLPAGLMLGASGSLAAVAANLVAVTLGNLIGGAACIAVVLGHAHAAEKSES